MTRLSRGFSLVRIHNGELLIVRSDLKERVRMELGNRNYPINLLKTLKLVYILFVFIRRAKLSVVLPTNYNSLLDENATNTSSACMYANVIIT